MKRILIPAALMAAAGLFVTGCSSSSDASATAPSDGAPTTAAATEAPRGEATPDAVAENPWAKMADTARKAGNYKVAIENYEKAIAESSDLLIRNDLAWLLATCPDPDFHNGARALELANECVAATDGKDPRYIDTLAAAQARAGNFEDAAMNQQKVIDLLPEGHVKRDECEVRLAYYQMGRAYTRPAY